MINEPRPYASLSSHLLARKGMAKPAMRPQGFTGFEDLGWNDMGHEPANNLNEVELPEHIPSSIAALTPPPRTGRMDEPVRDDAGEDNEAPVVAQQRAIAESFEAEPEAPAPQPRAPAEIVTLPKRALPAAIKAGRKSAFTLRLDADRHLRLRLATALMGKSAQQIVTGALDALIESMPEIEALAERVPAAKAKRN
jgi:hypothetical protein